MCSIYEQGLICGTAYIFVSATLCLPTQLLFLSPNSGASVNTHHFNSQTPFHNQAFRYLVELVM